MPKSRVRLTIEISPEEMVQYDKRAYEKLAKGIEIKGFRLGNAPRALVIERVGQNRFMKEIFDLALPSSYSQALTQEKLTPVQPPKVIIQKFPSAAVGSDSGENILIYQAEVDTMPDVEVGDYTKIKVNKVKPEKVKSEEIKKVLDNIQMQHAKFNDVARPAKAGDRVEIDFEGSINGVVQEKLSSKNYPLILGKKVMVPGFEDNLVGLVKGQEKEFEIKFPKEFRIKDIAGKKVKFKVKVNDVKEIEKPPLDDNLAKKFNQKTVENLKKEIEKSIAKDKEMIAKRKMENEIIDKLISETKVEVPESLVEQELDRMVTNLKSQVERYRIPFDKYLERMKKSPEDLRKEWRQQAAKTVKVGLALRGVVEKEKIDPHDKEAAKKAMDKLFEYAVE